MNVYGGFLQSFHRDTQFIKSYAGADILDHLWKSKVGASDKRSVARTRGYANNDNDYEDTRREPAISFHDTARNLCDHIYATMKAAAKVRHARDSENAGHVYTKLGKSVKGLTRDMEFAPLRAKDTKNLMTELEMLLTFLSANGADRETLREAQGKQGHQVEQRYSEQEGPDDYEGEQGTSP